MIYKRLFLGICLTLLMVISQAQERVLPKFKLGGALRFNYNFCDWKPGVEILVSTCYTSNCQAPTEISF